MGLREMYGLIHDILSDLHHATLIIGDSGLAIALKPLQEWVAGETIAGANCRSSRND